MQSKEISNLDANQGKEIILKLFERQIYFLLVEKYNAESVCIFALYQSQQSQCLKLGEIADVIKNSL